MNIFKTNFPRRGILRQLAKKMLVLIFCLFVAIGLFLFNQRFLTISDINCQNDNLICPEVIQNIVNQRKGHSLLFLRQRELSRQIISTGLVDQVKISVKLPGQLIIKLSLPSSIFYLNSFLNVSSPSLSFETSTVSGQIISPAYELANFVATNSGKTFRLFESGVLDQSEVGSNLYLIASGIPSRNYLVSAFVWLKAIANAKIVPDRIYLLPRMLVVKIKDQPDYLFDFDSDPSKALSALQRLLMAVTINGLSVIDFRYSNPILK